MEDNSLKILKSKRAQLKSKLTRFKSYLDSDNTSQLKIRYKDFEGLLSLFEDIQGQIETIDDTPEDDSERETFENTYYDLASKAEDILLAIDTQNSTNSTSRDSLLGNSCSVKLPAINLPKFTGNYEDWLPFYDLFQSLVHNNETLSDVEKFHYLKTSLHDTVKPILHSLEASSENYATAWLLLKERYDNKRIIVNKHISALVNIEPLHKENAIFIRHFLDTINKHVRCLKSLGQPIDNWDTILIFILSKKLDMYTLKHWESQNTTPELPTMTEFTDFLQSRCQILEAIDHAKPSNTSQPHQHKTPSTQQVHQSTKKVGLGVTRVTPHSQKGHYTVNHLAISSSRNCGLCNNSTHQLFKCSTFLNQSTSDRWSTVKGLGLCTNCLNKGHISSNCTSSGCRICSKRHNTLLHVNESAQPSSHQPPSTTRTAYQSNNHTPAVLVTSKTSSPSQILLSTALVYAQGKNGVRHICRALLDNGSQTNFLTNKMVQVLNLKKSNNCINIKGINQMPSHTTGSVTCSITSRCTNFNQTLQFHTVPTITHDMPTTSIDTSTWELPRWVQLADPDLGKRGPIDMLLGGEVFLSLLSVGQFIPISGGPILQKTLLGWIAGGKVTCSAPPINQLCLFTTTEKIHSQMKKFWEIEEIDEDNNLTSEEHLCEDHYANTIERNEEGRYIVSLPLKENLSELGESYNQALTRLQSTERKLEKNPNLKAEYHSFMNEYITLNHMEPVLKSDNNDNHTFYLPHLPVIRENSSTTKVRVVFDASAKSTSGLSLNDTMRVGPTIQPDLFSIVCKFRTHKYVLTADIAKMYRQVLVSENHCDLQRILWRFNPEDEVSEYRLKTVTYGMAAAPYLAIRTLHQLATDEGHLYPEASKTLREDFYVDDMMTGANTLQAALQLQDHITALLKMGGFELRKWSANHPKLLQAVPENIRERDSEYISSNDQSIKVLGMLWHSEKDIFHFSITQDRIKSTTKRTILSYIAGLFDPLGLLGPVVLTAKILMQTMWALKLGWDESLPQHIHQAWTKFRSELSLIEHLQIPRPVIQHQLQSTISLHGFCDASASAYGACIYVREESSEGKTQVTLLCSKSRVAPLKKQTIPRLELCGAVLLSKLLAKTKSLNMNHQECILWCDSSIVLAWIKSEPSTWKTFVSNRVQEIVRLTKDCNWHHVNTKDNPADLVSRGLTPKQIKDSHLWWNGPSWLTLPKYKWPIQEDRPVEIPEKRSKCNDLTILITQTEAIPQFIININNFSALCKLQRVTAFCIRFIKNCRFPDMKYKGALTTKELRGALHILIKKDQEQHFNEDIKFIKQRQCEKLVKLRSLQPFIDNEGLMRVGGRLDNAPISYDQKHPIILPKDSHLAKLIIEQEHKRTLHAGPQLLLASLKMRFWPIGGRNAVRKVTRKCVKCFKVKPTSTQPLMGNLPKLRLTPSRPFSTTGIDYCGPTYIKSSHLKNSKLIKAYIAVFVCFTTKAIHLELVSGLTTEAFLAALKRFVSRRGLCQEIYSDNGTNFVGAYKEIQEVKRLLQSEKHQTAIINATSQDQVNWHFIPPHSPHFGGLWEAGVKSIKHHLKRVVGNAKLTFEQMYTVLTMVEACLNSRPLTPLSNDPNDSNPLTPGHFLTGGALISLPEPDVTTIPTNRLTHWQRVQQLTQHFWVRWSKEYLSLTQQRSRWKSDPPQIQTGQLVIVKDDNLPPLKWTTARVVAVHPGNDGRIRVATIRTHSGNYKRAVNRLCVLPIYD